MQWILEWGEFEENLESLAAETGEMPEALANKPDISGSEWLWKAYAELGTCRQVGMDVGAIPWTARVQYVERNNLSRYEEDLLVHCINVLDEIQRKHLKGK